MAQIWAAITCDVKGSRQRDPVQLREEIQRALAEINAVWAGSLASPFRLTLGDEWQGILHRPEESYRVWRGFQRALGPRGIEFYTGVGLGEISTPVRVDVREMDGPAFHLAREALALAKEAGGGVVFRSPWKQLDEALGALILLLERVRAGRTARQNQVIALYEEMNSLEQVGNRLGITRQAVSKILRAALFHEEERAEKALAGLISWAAHLSTVQS